MTSPRKRARSSFENASSKFCSRRLLILWTILVGLILRLFYVRNELSPPSSSQLSVSSPLSSSSSSLSSSLLSSSPSSLSFTQQQNDLALLTSPWYIPQGKAVAMPSILLDDTASNETKDFDRKIYGGKGDKGHLGGFTNMDMMGISPSAWKWMVERIGVKSVLDVGCGRGISTSWFLLHDVHTMCVEGSHDAYERSIIPVGDGNDDTNREEELSKIMIEHDFSRGPWWPAETFDAIWCVEFLEHVGRNYMHNYLPAFRKAALLFVTSSLWGGWHHVEVHEDDWWITKFEMFGFVYSDSLTARVKRNAENDTRKIAPNGEEYWPQHIWLNMKVFINPIVAALPKHAHLMAEHGCYAGRQEFQKGIRRECGTNIDKSKGAQVVESKLPKSFYPINITLQMDDAWGKLIKDIKAV